MLFFHKFQMFSDISFILHVSLNMFSYFYYLHFLSQLKVTIYFQLSTM